jgi:peroxiredoxin
MEVVIMNRDLIHEPKQSNLQELTQQFLALEPKIKDSSEKQALSLLHGMIHALWRNQQKRSSSNLQGLVLQDIADLYKTAPKMEFPAENTPLPVGTQAPDFQLPDADGNLTRLSDYRGKPVILVFYPLDWSPGCSQQLDLYQQELDEFEKRNAKIVAISVDSIYSHAAWSAVRGITFPLLADFHPKGEVAQRYHVYRSTDGFAERALYVLDSDGIIQYAHVSPYVHHIPDIYELFSVLDKMKEPHPLQ